MLKLSKGEKISSLSSYEDDFSVLESYGLIQTLRLDQGNETYNVDLTKYGKIFLKNNPKVKNPYFWVLYKDDLTKAATIIVR